MYTAPIPFGFDDLRDGCSRSRSRSRSGCCSSTGSRPCGAGRSTCGRPPLFALGAISAMSVGLAGELAYSVIPVGWQLDNTTAAQGDTIAVLVGGAVLGGFAALHYWFPKLTGRTMGEGLGQGRASRRSCSALYVYVLTMFLAGLKGQPVDIYKFFDDTGAGRLQPRRLDRRPSCSRSGSCSSSATPPTASDTGVRAGHDPGAARRSSGSRSRRRRSTTSTPSPTCAAPSRCTTSARAIRDAHRGVAPAGRRPRRRRPAPASPSRSSRRARRGRRRSLSGDAPVA